MAMSDETCVVTKQHLGRLTRLGSEQEQRIEELEAQVSRLQDVVKRYVHPSDRRDPATIGLYPGDLDPVTGGE